MHVKQAANVIELLEYFAKRLKPATMAEISDDLGWPRSSTFNLVGTLAELGFLYEPRTRGGYYPGPRWSDLSRTITDAEPLPDSLLRIVANVAAETGETTAIGASAGTNAMLLHVVESTQPIRYFARVGDRVPIHASSVGRALLAQYGQDERYSLYNKVNFQRFSETTPIDAAAVEAELAAAAARGYHQSLSEFVPDLAGVAVPVIADHRRLSLVVAGPVGRNIGRRGELGAILRRHLDAWRPG